jgi:Putative zinc-finger
MKQESNNQMDLILRKLARESTTVPVMEGNGSPETAAEKHLDADELNAYAENALPLKTRARYTEHLADCTRCRQIVSQLSLAAGLIVEEKVPTLSGWKTFLSSLFSPMVLRYAVPAVLLLTVASIGLFVFRSSTSQQERRDVVASSAEQKPPEPTSVLADQSLDTGNKTNSSPEQVATTKTNGEREGTANAKGDVVDSKKAGEPKREQKETTATDQISAAAAPASANQAPPSSMESVTVQEQAVRNEEAAQRKTQPAAKPAETVAVTSADEQRAKEPEKQTRESEKAARPSVGGYAGSPAGLSKLKSAPRAAVDRASEQDKPINGRDREDKDNSEIRSIAGRRFRKEGSTWVDTAFDSSRRTVNLTRGSEQYRALIADEPEIKTIADQLSGEVIVVWKGTAYRIR